jgi:hypothetical protein
MGIELNKIDFRLTEHGYEPGQAQVLHGLEKPQISESDYLARLDEINETWRIITDSSSGRQFEVAVVNQDKLDKDAVLFPSTQFSSLIQNPGNAIELAAHGAANPNAARIYIAYFGNGGSQSLTRQERKYLAKTGRFTFGNGTEGQPYGWLPSVSAMAYALAENGYTPNHVSGDESGARLGLGVMSALGSDTIKDAYFNGPPGVSAKGNYSTGMLKEDLDSRKERRKTTDLDDSLPGEVVPPRISQAKDRLPGIYKAITHRGLLLGTYLHAPVNMNANRKAFAGHNDLGDPHNHALIQDTVAALSFQKAIIGMQFNRLSRLHDIEACLKFGKLVMDRIPHELRDEKRGLEIIIGTGTLDSHTDLPQERWRTERYALPSIMNLFKLLTGGRIKPETVQPEQAERQIA